MPFVSVIIPNYNHARFLHERIQSVLAQRFDDYEIILLDDASTDNSRAVLESFRSHPKVKTILYNRENSGSPFRQWYKGIEQAGGQWIWIAESDDGSEPDFLEECVKETKRHANLTMVFCASWLVDQEGGKRERQSVNFAGAFGNGIDLLREQMLFQNVLPNAGAVLFRHEALRGVDRSFLQSFRWCGDWALWNALLLKGNYACIDRPLNFFRRHDAAWSNRFYREGYLYKEGFALARRCLHQLHANTALRWKTYKVWSRHLLRQYRENRLQNNRRIYVFKPYRYCLLLHAFIPFLLIFDRLKPKPRGGHA